MSNPEMNSKPIIPNITGNPMLDTAIRIGLTSGSAALTAIILTWLNAHGFVDPHLSVLIGGVVLSTLIGAATVIWSFVQTRLNKLSVVQHTIEAVATGQISDAVKVAALKAPSVSEEQITKALNNAETIKGQQ